MFIICAILQARIVLGGGVGLLVQEAMAGDVESGFPLWKDASH